MARVTVVSATHLSAAPRTCALDLCHGRLLVGNSMGISSVRCPSLLDAGAWVDEGCEGYWNLGQHLRSIQSLTVSRQARFCATVAENEYVCVVHQMDAYGGRTFGVHKTLQHKHQVTTAAYAADGTTLLVATSDGRVRGWEIDADGSTTVTANLAHDYKVIAICASACATLGESIVACLCGDGSVWVWNTTKWCLLTKIQPRRALDDVAWFPDAERADILIDREAGWRGHFRNITACDLSEDGLLLSTASRDGTCKIWELTPVLYDSHEAAQRALGVGPAVYLAKIQQAEDTTGTSTSLLASVSHYGCVQHCKFGRAVDKIVITCGADASCIGWLLPSGQKHFQISLVGAPDVTPALVALHYDQDIMQHDPCPADRPSSFSHGAKDGECLHVDMRLYLAVGNHLLACRIRLHHAAPGSHRLADPDESVSRTTSGRGTGVDRGVDTHRSAHADPPEGRAFERHLSADARRRRSFARTNKPFFLDGVECPWVVVQRQRLLKQGVSLRDIGWILSSRFLTPMALLEALLQGLGMHKKARRIFGEMVQQLNMTTSTVLRQAAACGNLSLLAKFIAMVWSNGQSASVRYPRLSTPRAGAATFMSGGPMVLVIPPNAARKFAGKPPQPMCPATPRGPEEAEWAGGAEPETVRLTLPAGRGAGGGDCVHVSKAAVDIGIASALAFLPWPRMGMSLTSVDAQVRDFRILGHHGRQRDMRMREIRRLIANAGAADNLLMKIPLFDASPDRATPRNWVPFVSKTPSPILRACPMSMPTAYVPSQGETLTSFLQEGQSSARPASGKAFSRSASDMSSHISNEHYVFIDMPDGGQGSAHTRMLSSGEDAAPRGALDQEPAVGLPARNGAERETDAIVGVDDRLNFGVGYPVQEEQGFRIGGDCGRHEDPAQVQSKDDGESDNAKEQAVAHGKENAALCPGHSVDMAEASVVFGESVGNGDESFTSQDWSGQRDGEWTASQPSALAVSVRVANSVSGNDASFGSPWNAHGGVAAWEDTLHQSPERRKVVTTSSVRGGRPVKPLPLHNVPRDNVTRPVGSGVKLVVQAALPARHQSPATPRVTTTSAKRPMSGRPLSGVLINEDLISTKQLQRGAVTARAMHLNRKNQVDTWSPTKRGEKPAANREYFRNRESEPIVSASEPIVSAVTPLYRISPDAGPSRGTWSWNGEQNAAQSVDGADDSSHPVETHRAPPDAAHHALAAPRVAQGLPPGIHHVPMVIVSLEPVSPAHWEILADRRQAHAQLESGWSGGSLIQDVHPPDKLRPPPNEVPAARPHTARQATAGETWRLENSKTIRPDQFQPLKFEPFRRFGERLMGDAMSNSKWQSSLRNSIAGSLLDVATPRGQPRVSKMAAAAVPADEIRQPTAAEIGLAIAKARKLSAPSMSGMPVDVSDEFPVCISRQHCFLACDGAAQDMDEHARLVLRGPCRPVPQVGQSAP